MRFVDKNDLLNGLIQDNKELDSDEQNKKLPKQELVIE